MEGNRGSPRVHATPTQLQEHCHSPFNRAQSSVAQWLPKQKRVWPKLLLLFRTTWECGCILALMWIKLQPEHLHVEVQIQCTVTSCAVAIQCCTCRYQDINFNYLTPYCYYGIKVNSPRVLANTCVLYVEWMYSLNGSNHMYIVSAVQIILFKRQITKKIAIITHALYQLRSNYLQYKGRNGKKPLSYRIAENFEGEKFHKFAV